MGIIMSATVGYAITVSPIYAAVSVVGLALLSAIFFWPRQSSVTTRTVLMYSTLIGYLVPLLAFGKTYATIGVSPVYLPDVLLLVAVMFMLSKMSLRLITPFPSVCALIALLALYSVYVGYQNGYHGVIRGLVLALYPMIAVIIAAWLAGQSASERLFAVLPKYILPVVAVGLGVLLVTKATVIAAAAGLYLAVGGAFAIVPGMPGRRRLAISVVLGTIMLVGLNAKRGPALAILLALLAAWMASTSFRPATRAITTMLAIGAIAGMFAVTVSLGILVPTKIPVVGPLVGRALATKTATNSEDIAAVNNVGIREAMWSFALHAADEHPFFGVGADHPIEVHYREDNVAKEITGPHNSFIGYAFYAGYPAAVLALLAFVIGFSRMWRLRRASVYAPALLGAIVAVVMTALTNVAFETTYIGGPSWLVLGAAVGLAGALDMRARSYVSSLSADHHLNRSPSPLLALASIGQPRLTVRSKGQASSTPTGAGGSFL